MLSSFVVVMSPKQFLTKEQEVRQATKEFPGVEIGEAYRRWKELRGEQPLPKFSTGDRTLKLSKQYLLEKAKKPCEQEGCDGVRELESICAGCVEGRLGYKSKWTCSKCLHRELSKKDYL